MGREIPQSHFHKSDFKQFEQRLRDETELVFAMAKNNKKNSEGTVQRSPRTAGFELELFFVDENGAPAGIAPELLEKRNNKDEDSNSLSADPHWTYELGTYQIEYNSPVFEFRGKVLSEMLACFERALDQANTAAQSHHAMVAAIGSLPTLSPDDLSLPNMAPLHRYKALNEQLLRIRKGSPLQMDLHEDEHICRPNVMLESCASSTQWHWGLPDDRDEVSQAAAFNAGLLASAIVVAVGANSVFVCGNDSGWVECRIPICEACYDLGPSGQPNRFFFGSGFVERSLTELYQENLTFPVLLPTIDFPEEDDNDDSSGDKVEDREPNNKALKKECHSDTNPIAHLALHNGNIWRWHRPIVTLEKSAGSYIDETKGIGNLAWRMEHRTLPSGPTPVDSVANAALYYGLVHYLQKQFLQHSSPTSSSPANAVDFGTVRGDFYRAAKDGLEAEITWGEWHHDPDRAATPTTIRELLMDGGHLLDAVQQTLLDDLDLDAHDVAYFMEILRYRVSTGQTGAVWQRQKQEQQHDQPTLCCASMMQAYMRHSRTGKPVAGWPLD